MSTTKQPVYITPPPQKKRKKVQVDCSSDPSRTKQSFAADADINRIVKGFTETGQLPLQNTGEPQYGEVPDGDFFSVMLATTEAQQSFDRLPESIKARFGFDPMNLMEFASDPENAPEMAKLGFPVLSSLPPEEPKAPEAPEGGETAPQAPPEGE